jgi:hypothetical protein
VGGKTVKKRVLFAGLSGGMVMLTWLFVTNAVLPFKSNLIHRVLPLQDQLEVHEALKKNIAEPGTYSIPYLSREEEDRFPDYRNQPVYTVIFEEYAHGIPCCLVEVLQEGSLCGGHGCDHRSER